MATGSTSCALASSTSCRAGVALHVGRVDDGQPAGGEPLAGDVVQHVEGVGGRRLVVLVVGDQAAAEVAGEHLGGTEVLAREGRLARAGHADQDHEAELGDGQLGHDASRALWSEREDRQLGGRARPPGRRRPIGQEPYGVAGALADARRPVGELVRGSTRTGGRGGASCPRPALEAHVVLDVGGRHDHRARAGVAEHRALQRGQALGVDVLDDLHQHGGVVAREPLVPVGQRRLDADAAALAGGRASGRGRSRRSASARARADTSTPSTSRELRVGGPARAGASPSPQPRSTTRARALGPEGVEHRLPALHDERTEAARCLVRRRAYLQRVERRGRRPRPAATRAEATRSRWCAR